MNTSKAWKRLYHKIEKAAYETHSSLQQEKQIVYLTVSLLAMKHNVYNTSYNQLFIKPTSQEISERLSRVYQNYIPLESSLKYEASSPEYLSNYYQLKLTCSHSFNARKLLQACPDWQSLKEALASYSIEYLKIHVGYKPMSEVQYGD